VNLINSIFLIFSYIRGGINKNLGALG